MKESRLSRRSRGLDESINSPEGSFSDPRSSKHYNFKSNQGSDEIDLLEQNILKQLNNKFNKADSFSHEDNSIESHPKTGLNSVEPSSSTSQTF